MIMILLLTALATALVGSFLRKFGRVCSDCTLVSNLREIEHGENIQGVPIFFFYFGSQYLRFKSTYWGR